MACTAFGGGSFHLAPGRVAAPRFQLGGRATCPRRPNILTDKPHTVGGGAMGPPPAHAFPWRLHSGPGGGSARFSFLLRTAKRGCRCGPKRTSTSGTTQGRGLLRLVENPPPPPPTATQPASIFSGSRPKIVRLRLLASGTRKCPPLLEANVPAAFCLFPIFPHLQPPWGKTQAIWPHTCLKAKPSPNPSNTS